MGVERTKPSATAIIVVDVQEKLVPTMPAERLEQLYRAARILLGAAAELRAPVIVTEQYPKGLGGTVSPLRELLADAGVKPIEKMAFSACNEPTFVEALKETKADAAIIIGMETHICVFQTVRDLAARGVRVDLPIDGVVSRRHPHHGRDDPVRLAGAERHRLVPQAGKASAVSGPHPNPQRRPQVAAADSAAAAVAVAVADSAAAAVAASLAAGSHRDALALSPTFGPMRQRVQNRYDLVDSVQQLIGDLCISTSAHIAQRNVRLLGLALGVIEPVPTLRASPVLPFASTCRHPTPSPRQLRSQLRVVPTYLPNNPFDDDSQLQYFVHNSERHEAPPRDGSPHADCARSIRASHRGRSPTPRLRRACQGWLAAAARHQRAALARPLRARARRYNQHSQRRAILSPRREHP